MYELPLIYTVCTYNKGRCAVHIDTEKSLMLSRLSGIWRGHYNIDIIKKTLHIKNNWCLLLDNTEE